ncbi:MAG: hypothetical protein DWC00_06165 [Candidatus Poseidoniales archaeon]|nr:MAG: hypothetical protein DWC00_06165 [Candidatus Poseidoniales archaeon]
MKNNKIKRVSFYTLVILVENWGRKMTQNVTVEACSPSTIVPQWLLQHLEDGSSDILIIYPNETVRENIMKHITATRGAIDSSRHTTLKRLCTSLQMDFRFPVIIPRSTMGIVQVHKKFSDAASEFRFPRMHPDASRTWSLSKTERLLQLHRFSTMHGILRKWEDDPGVTEADRLLSTFRDSNLLHEHQVMEELTNALLQTDTPIPYSLTAVKGIVLLNHPPDFHSSEKQFFTALATRIPIHHLSVQGSFRLGLHGAYIDDEIQYVKSEEELPDWIPEHPVIASPEKENRTEGIHLVSFDQASQVLDAALSAIRLYRQHYSGKILVVDADQNRRSVWKRRLQQIGLDCDAGSETVGSTSAVQAVLRFLSIAEGQDAWSGNKLFDIVQSQAFPIIENLFSNLSHPINEDWRPRPNLDILENIGRSFHVIGGNGALFRWLGSLSVATPTSSESYRRKAEEQAIEETRWWLYSLARVWSPFLDSETRLFIQEPLVGNSSGVELPLPKINSHHREVLADILEACEWGQLFSRTSTYDGSIGGLQSWIQTIDSISQYESSIDFIDICKLSAHQTKLPPSRVRHSNVVICTPEQAYGAHADIVLFVGIDSESWSMKPPRVPWIDDAVRVQLGLNDSDLPIRRGRHVFKSLLSTCKSAILFDTKHDDSAGNSTPVAEYLAEIELAGKLSNLSTPPDFLVSAISSGAGWSFITRDDGNWLTYKSSALVLEGSNVELLRAENLPRDRRQRTGLALKSGKTPEVNIHSPISLTIGAEKQLNLDRYRRQPKFKATEKEEAMSWSYRDNLLTADDLVLSPSLGQAKTGGGRTVDQWPHLGYKKNGNARGPSIDPRPLPPTQTGSDTLSSIWATSQRSDDSKVWSTNKLTPWINCPRLAWSEQILQAKETQPEVSEDLAPLARGTLVHSIEEFLLSLLGVNVGDKPLDEGTPMHIGLDRPLEQIWESLLLHLSQLAPWLSRTNAVSVHRCNDLVGCSPEEWTQWLEGEAPPQIGGRLGQLLLADSALNAAGPIASEWPLESTTGQFIELEGFDNELNSTKLKIFGRIDRVDALVLDADLHEEVLEKGLIGDSKDVIPLNFNGEGPPAKRLIIIRDLKTIEGPDPKKVGLRHASGLFKEIQLALYARAWEIAHPGDRVIGVGISEVGDTTRHFVELDPAFAFLPEELYLGERTSFSKNHYRIPSEDNTPTSNPFRAWISSRLTTAIRARDASDSGWNHPTPGKHCNYCSLANDCPSALIGVDVK